MFVTNTTNIAKDTGVKPIGIGEVLILPGETKEVPDEIAYCKIDGKKAVIPALDALARTNQIRIESNVVPPKDDKPAKEKDPEPESVPDTEPKPADDPVPAPAPDPAPEPAAETDKPKNGGRSKKAD